jgi:hypothetical protein
MQFSKDQAINSKAASTSFLEATTPYIPTTALLLETVIA